MQRLFVLIPNGDVEFLQEIEPRLGDVAENLPAVIRRTLPAHKFLPLQAIQEAGYTWRLFNHPLCDVECRKSLQTRPAQDAQDVELLRGNVMLIEHRRTKMAQIIGGMHDAYHSILPARMRELLLLCFAAFCFHFGGT